MTRRTRENLRQAATHGVLLLLSIVFLAPLLWMVSTAIKPLDQTMLSPPVWIPERPQWENFWKALSYNAEDLGYIPFLVYGRNTLYVTVLAVIGSVVSNTLVAYSFARLRWRGRDLLFGVTLATMMVPGPVLMVPTYVLFREFGWIGTFRPLWVPAFFGGAFNIFLLRQFLKTIPMELSEAARIDGASEWQTFLRVIVPLARPALTVVALFTFMWAWNDFMGPLLYLTDQHTFTLSMGLQFFQSQHTGTPWNLLMAASLIVVLPVIFVFLFAQRVFIQGIATTGIKG
ncbi:MAG: carbohydrate ABC transporter permease [Armatimonadetes bacterium]|nr:carbohydrate ABC transporter permease [Armatimonadota bacterium]